MGIGQKKGFKHTEETKKIISEYSKKFWNNSDYVKKVLESRKKIREQRGYVNSPETRAKLSKIMKDKIERGEFNPKDISPFVKGHKKGMLGKHHSKKTKELMKKSNRGVCEKTRVEQREWRKNYVFPFNDTKIELKIQNYLKLLHIEFMTHYYISEITHSYRCDVIIPSTKTIIECDGCYWHGCKICNKNINEFQEKQIEEDNIRTIELIEKGYNIIRLWEHKIRVMKLNDLKQRLNI